MRQFIYTPRSGDRMFAMQNNGGELNVTQLGNKSWVIETLTTNWVVGVYHTANPRGWYREGAKAALCAVARGGTLSFAAWDVNGDIHVLCAAVDAKRFHRVMTDAAIAASVVTPDIPAGLIASPVVGVVGWASDDRPVLGWVSDGEMETLRDQHRSEVHHIEAEKAFDVGLAAFEAADFATMLDACSRIEHHVHALGDKADERAQRRLASAAEWRAVAASAGPVVTGTVVAVED